MSTDELVSVIVPVYRVEEYLHRCVSSLLAQTHSSLEIILVDDGSPDRCGQMCDEYAAADSRVRVIHQDNSGPSAARNAGIEAATGAYLTFVDPDDWVHVEMVSHLLSMIHDTGADLAVCRFVRTDDEDVSLARRDGDRRTLDTREALELYGGPTTSWMTSPCAKLFLASLFRGIRFPVGRLYEDEFTTYRLVAAARRVVLSEAELYFYFMRPGSATAGAQGLQQLLDRVDALREQAEFFRTRGLDAVSGDCLRRAFLIQRQLRSRVAHSGDEAQRRRLAKDTKAVAASLRASQSPMPVKALASLYTVWPQPVDAAIAARALTGRSRHRFSVIIPTMQRSGHLRPLVDMYCAHDLVGEVIIINNVTDPLVFDDPKVRVLQQERNIYVNPAWNLGAAHALEKWLIISNDDIWFKPSLIDHVERVLRWPVGMVGPSWSAMNGTRDGHPRFIPAYRLPHGFGTLMFLRKADYLPIPEELLVMGGDDWLFEHQVHRNLQFVGARIGTQWSLTSARPEFDPIKQRDRENFRDRYHSPDYFERYAWEAKVLDVTKKAYDWARGVLRRGR